MYNFHSIFYSIQQPCQNSLSSQKTYNTYISKSNSDAKHFALNFISQRNNHADPNSTRFRSIDGAALQLMLCASFVQGVSYSTQYTTYGLCSSTSPDIPEGTSNNSTRHVGKYPSADFNTGNIHQQISTREISISRF